jgi:hypothetical protein
MTCRPGHDVPGDRAEVDQFRQLAWRKSTPVFIGTRNALVFLGKATGGRPMIIEMRTYTLRPGSIAEAEKRFGASLPAREKHSKLAAFWHTEVGPLEPDHPCLDL